jgi:hypothetical protein
MADLANRVLFMLICILNAMIVDFMTRRRLLQRRIYRLFIQRMPNEHVLNRSRIDLVVIDRFSCSHLTVKCSSIERSNLDHIFYGSQIRLIAIDLSLM